MEEQTSLSRYNELQYKIYKWIHFKVTNTSTLSWGSIHSHINICPGKSTMIDPQKGRRSNWCMAFKIILCCKSKSPTGLYWKVKILKYLVSNQRNDAEGINHQIKRVVKQQISVTFFYVFEHDEQTKLSFTQKDIMDGRTCIKFLK